MNKEVLKTKNLNNFGHVLVNSDHSLFVKKYYDFLKYKLQPSNDSSSPIPTLDWVFLDLDWTALDLGLRNWTWACQ